MKKALVLTLILLMGLTVFNGVALAGGGMGIPDGAVVKKQFPMSNLPMPKEIQHFNKVVDMGNGLKGEMLIGKDEQAFLEVWKPNSGKRDVYVWNGTNWEYKYSITNIVPGFEKPATLNTYKYANWREYTQHKVQMDDGNNPTPPPNPPQNKLSVSVSGKTDVVFTVTEMWVTTGEDQEQTETDTYTAHITGGSAPYTLVWSQDNFLDQSDVTARYVWSSNDLGTHTVKVTVVDASGQSAVGSLDVNVTKERIEPPEPPNPPDNGGGGNDDDDGQAYAQVGVYGSTDDVGKDGSTDPNPPPDNNGHTGWSLR